MSPSVDDIVERVRVAGEDLEREVRERHRRLKQNIPAYIREGNVFSLLTAPLIYSLIVPFVLLDFWVTVYQQVCFPIYGIAPVSRRRYFTIDRHALAYLNAIEKANCTYCSYANGVIAYVREVAARTEQYWCPIKHAREIRTPHARYRRFIDYGDAEGYRRRLPALRQALQKPRIRQSGRQRHRIGQAGRGRRHE